jgi:N-acyl-D-aspartate/D-glutamate deacylase
VTPGWVDVHTHYDGQVTWDSLLTPSCWHGVTDRGDGQLRRRLRAGAPGSHDFLIKLMEGVEDIPGTALAEGIKWEWESFPEYLDAVERIPHALDVGAQVPHAALRFYVMGERGADHQERPDARRDRHDGPARARRGARGRARLHDVAHAQPPRERRAPHAEPHRDVRRAGRNQPALRRGGLGRVRDRVGLPRSRREWELLRRDGVGVGRRCRSRSRRATVSPDAWRASLRKLEEANAAGLPMRGQVAARAIGTLLGSRRRCTRSSATPSFRAIAALPLAEKVARLRDPELRRRLLAEQPRPGLRMFAGPGARSSRSAIRPTTSRRARKSVAAEARRRGVSPDELLLDLLIADDGHALLYRPLLNYSAVRSRRDPRDADASAHVPGLGDAGAHCGPDLRRQLPHLSPAALGTRAHARREAPGRGAREAPDRRHAALVGPARPRRARAGQKATCNLIDPDALALAHPEIVYDLPAAGKRLVQRARGYRATLVSGEVVLENGEPTGALPGQARAGLPQRAA